MPVGVDVWWLDLSLAAPLTAEALALLDAGERERHAGYLVAPPARVFATTRIALRRLLGERLGRDPASLRFVADAHGKPRIADAPRAFFNVAHGAGHALVALCDRLPVGVDVEAAGAVPPGSAVVPSMCTARERAWLDAVGPVDDAAPTRLWVRKEAVLKALGVGLLAPMTDVEFADPAATSGVVAVGADALAWQDLALPPRVLGTLAVATGGVAAVDVALRPWRG